MTMKLLLECAKVFCLLKADALVSLRPGSKPKSQMPGHSRGMEGLLPVTGQFSVPCIYRNTSPQTSQAPARDTMVSALTFNLPQAYLGSLSLYLPHPHG